MITCYDLMFYEPSTSFLTSLLWYKHFHSTFLKNICRFGNFITACMQKTQNKSGHSPSTSQNILILHQNPLQHPISALSASHVIINCETGIFVIQFYFLHFFIVKNDHGTVFNGRIRFYFYPIRLRIDTGTRRQKEKLAFILQMNRTVPQMVTATNNSFC